MTLALACPTCETPLIYTGMGEWHCACEHDLPASESVDCPECGDACYRDLDQEETECPSCGIAF